MSALTNLGYGQPEAARAVASAPVATSRASMTSRSTSAMRFSRDSFLANAFWCLIRFLASLSSSSSSLHLSLLSQASSSIESLLMELLLYSDLLFRMLPFSCSSQ